MRNLWGISVHKPRSVCVCVCVCVCDHMRMCFPAAAQPMIRGSGFESGLKAGGKTTHRRK